MIKEIDEYLKELEYIQAKKQAIKRRKEQKEENLVKELGIDLIK